MNDFKPNWSDIEHNEKWINRWVLEDPKLFTKTPHKVVKAAETTTLGFFPLIFLAWDYYNTGSFIQSTITCGRDFLWPAMVVAAKSFNASPYQMLATNVGGIAWTIYNCFFAEHPEHEAVKEEVSTDLGSASTLKGKITA